MEEINIEVLNTLIKHEKEFQSPTPSSSKEAIEKMLDDDFFEVGASGRTLSREHGVRTLMQRLERDDALDSWESSDFKVYHISDDSYLLTYTLVQEDNRVSKRATIWRKTNNGWSALYHQGTLVETSDLNSSKGRGL